MVLATNFLRRRSKKSAHQPTWHPLGIGILKGDVLSAPTYGVVGAHHGDVRAYRGGPPGFWEYVNREPTATVTVQRYTERFDGGELLAERTVSIDDAPTWRAVRRRLCRETPPAMAEAVVAATDESRLPTTVDQLGPVYSGDDRNLRVTLKYVSRTVPVGGYKLYLINLFVLTVASGGTILSASDRTRIDE